MKAQRKHALRAMAALALATLVPLAGCVNQKEEVLKYRKVLHSRPVPAPQVPTILTLADAMRLANNQDEQLASAGENYLQAIIAKDRAFSTFMPHIGLGAQDFQMRRFTTPPGAGPISQFFQTHYFNAPLATTLDVNILRDATGIKAADITTDQQKALLLDMQSNLLLEVAQSYYQVLSDQRSVAVLTRSLAVQKARVASVSREEKAGVALRLTVLQSQADAANTQVQLTNARDRVIKGRATLAFLIGVPNLNHARLVNNFSPHSPTPPEKALEQIALHDRQDLRSADFAVLAAQAKVQAAYQEYFPSVSVNMNTFLYKQQFPSDSWWSAMFSANFPIFEGGMIYQDIRTAWSQLRQAALADQRLRRQIHEQLVTAYEDWQNNLTLIRNLHTEYIAANAAYLQAQHSFKAGLATNLDVITAQDSALQSQLAWQTQLYQERLALLNLLRVSGRLTWPTIALLAKEPLHKNMHAPNPAAQKAAQAPLSPSDAAAVR